MLRLHAFVVLLVLPTIAVAIEPKFHAELDAKIKTAGETTEMRARLAGEMGKPLSIQINDQAETKIEATFTPLPEMPAQYQAVVKITRNGKVISEPMLISLYGRSCELEIAGGEMNGIRLSLNLLPR